MIITILMRYVLTINQKDHAQKLTNSELAFIYEDKYMSLQLMSNWMVIVKRM